MRSQSVRMRCNNVWVGFVGGRFLGQHPVTVEISVDLNYRPRPYQNCGHSSCANNLRSPFRYFDFRVTSRGRRVYPGDHTPHMLVRYWPSRITENDERDCANLQVLLVAVNNRCRPTLRIACLSLRPYMRLDSNNYRASYRIARARTSRLVWC